MGETQDHARAFSAALAMDVSRSATLQRVVREKRLGARGLMNIASRRPELFPNARQFAATRSSGIAAIVYALPVSPAAQEQAARWQGFITDIKTVMAAPAQDRGELWTELQEQRRREAEEAAAAAKARSEKLLTEQDYYTLPWYTEGKPNGLRDGWAYQSLDFWRWMVQYLQRNGPESIPEPSLSTITGPDGKTGREKGSPHAAWMEAQFRAFGQNRFPQPPAGTPERAEWDMAWHRATHPGGFWGSVARGFMRIGSTLLSVFGAVLAPFTGGASLIAAGILNSGLNAVKAKAAADAAKRAAAQDAVLLKAEYDKQERILSLELQKFYLDNQAWFLQHGLTSDKWAPLSITEKLDIIKAGAEGKVPAQAQPVTLQPAEQAKELQRIAAASKQAGIPLDLTVPELDIPLPETIPGGVYEVLVEGQSVGKFSSLTEASAAATKVTKVAERFEILLNGQSTGLKVRSAVGIISVPKEDSARLRSMTPSEVRSMVDRAASVVKGGKDQGGIPWWLVVGGAVAALKAAA